MSDPRQLLDAYAEQTVDVESDFGVFEPIKRADAAGAMLAALRAVLKLHPPIPNVTPPWCMHCSGGEHVEMWPCPTVRAIATALEAS